MEKWQQRNLSRPYSLNNQNTELVQQKSSSKLVSLVNWKTCVTNAYQRSLHSSKLIAKASSCERNTKKCAIRGGALLLFMHFSFSQSTLGQNFHSQQPMKYWVLGRVVDSFILVFALKLNNQDWKIAQACYLDFIVLIIYYDIRQGRISHIHKQNH